MSAIAYVNGAVFDATNLVLPEGMDTPTSRAMLLAIGLQESRFEHREQIGGPAHGFWQFEKGGGVRGVLRHSASKRHIESVAESLSYEPDVEVMYEAIVHNDVLACAFARLLLWTHPKPLPVRADVDGAWHYYISTWRPGKPHRETWDDFYEQAWVLTWMDASSPTSNG